MIPFYQHYQRRENAEQKRSQFRTLRNYSYSCWYNAEAARQYESYTRDSPFMPIKNNAGNNE